MRLKILVISLGLGLSLPLLSSLSAAAQSSGRGGGQRMGSSQAGGTYDPRGQAGVNGVKKVSRRGYEKVATLRLDQEGEILFLRVIPRAYTEKIAKIEVDGVRAEFDSDKNGWVVNRAKPKKKPKLSILVGDQAAKCKVQHFPHMGELAVKILQKGDEHGPLTCPASDWAG